MQWKKQWNACLNPCFSGTYSQRIWDDLQPYNRNVLILVLVEHTLRDSPTQQCYSENGNGLNPCFSGTYSQRWNRPCGISCCHSLNPCFSGTYSQSHSGRSDESQRGVLILVLVEHTLGEQLLQRTLFQSITLVNSEYLSVFNR